MCIVGSGQYVMLAIEYAFHFMKIFVYLINQLGIEIQILRLFLNFLKDRQKNKVKHRISNKEPIHDALYTNKNNCFFSKLSLFHNYYFSSFQVFFRLLGLYFDQFQGVKFAQSSFGVLLFQLSYFDFRAMSNSDVLHIFVKLR